MLRSKHFVNLVNEAVNDGFEKGNKFFMENLESQLNQEQLFESVGGEENYFNNLLKSNITEKTIDLNEGLEAVSDEDIDNLLEKYGITS
ncbi:MAG: hypothetical protein ACOC33_00750 [bacterium]